MRRVVIAGNWKMNNLVSDTRALIEEIIPAVKDVKDVEVIVAPSFVSLLIVKEMIKGTNIKLAAQNTYPEAKGAFTGEVSPEMLKDIGCDYVIIGHSERRQYFKETNDFLNKKIKKALGVGLDVIYCIGEALEDREAGKTFDVVKAQLEGGLEGISNEEMARIIIAYEPVWAIGTGKTATNEQAEEVHANIRQWLDERFSEAVSENTVIQYGGSVKPDNVKGLMAQKNIDGALVGGASLKADSFAALVNFKNGE